MNEVSGTTDFRALGEDVLKRVPGVVEVWYRPESEGSVELRLELADDSWEAREQAIDELVRIRLERIGEVSIGYSFARPHVAEDAVLEQSTRSAERVHSFV